MSTENATPKPRKPKSPPIDFAAELAKLEERGPSFEGVTDKLRERMNRVADAKDALKKAKKDARNLVKTLRTL